MKKTVNKYKNKLYKYLSNILMQGGNTYHNLKQDKAI